MAAKNRAGAIRAVDAEGKVEETEIVADAGAETTAKTEAPAAEAPVAAAEAPKKKRRGFILPVILLAIAGAGGWYGYQYWVDGRFMVSTDDAYIQGDIATISPKVSGYVEKVNVVANQHVRQGDPLVTLDAGDYRIAVDQAKAQINSAKLSLDRIDAQIVGAEAALKQAEAQQQANLAQQRGAELAQNRAEELSNRAVSSAATLDAADVALSQANAAVAAGEAGIAAARANIGLLHAQRAEAESQIKSLDLALKKAERDLSFTTMKAPYDGIIGNVAIREGDLVSPGARLAALVPSEELFIEANFKETQVAELVPGEKVHIHVDAYKDQDIIGSVTSISPASGSVFSMLPAENATGNFTKVVQRIPVRIAIPKEKLDEGILRAGMSVVVDVDSRTAPKT
jgi:membrane fusion protein (multidrug efflux system)